MLPIDLALTCRGATIEFIPPVMWCNSKQSLCFLLPKTHADIDMFKTRVKDVKFTLVTILLNSNNNLWISYYPKHMPKLFLIQLPPNDLYRENIYSQSVAAGQQNNLLELRLCHLSPLRPTNPPPHKWKVNSSSGNHMELNHAAELEIELGLGISSSASTLSTKHRTTAVLGWAHDRIS